MPVWNVLIKPLANGDYAIAALNRNDVPQSYSVNFTELGLNEGNTK